MDVGPVRATARAKARNGGQHAQTRHERLELIPGSRRGE